MLKKTFCHIDGITVDSEKLLWDNGIAHWEDFLQKADILDCLPKGKIESIKSELPLSQNALKQKDLHYFKARLPAKEHWRLFNMGKAAYVDIETTGVSKAQQA